MMVRAQEALARKLGSLPTNRSLTESALEEYIAAFDAPLPEDSISALAQLFKVDCQLTQQADDALAEMGGLLLPDSPGLAPSAVQGAQVAAA